MKIRERMEGHEEAIKVETLIPDFQGLGLRAMVRARPDVLNHNIETVRRIFPGVRAKGDYNYSLELLGEVKALQPNMVTKSGMMVGLGEEWDEILQTMEDLREVNCDLLTIGQYLRPSKKHAPISKFYTPDEFQKLAAEGLKLGFSHVAAGPLVRSSYHADEQHSAAALVLA
ncbi:MAG: lipoic acid synthetase [Chloroflexi bacterium]|nr:MAG: lipoic acid synthetase [Chloroflexota bacterium]